MTLLASFRSAADWRADKLPLTTGSDRACKLYDAALTQVVTWKEDSALGGLEKVLSDCVAEDPNFVMGHVMSVGLNLIGTGYNLKNDANLCRQLSHMKTLSSTEKITNREKCHVEALTLFSDGFTEQAAQVWEDILLDHPTDMLALKFAHDMYFYLGKSANIRDSIASVLPCWKPTLPLYSYLHGMHAFGLEETNLYPQAEKAARKALDLNCEDAWATHALAHVYEMEGRTKEGIAFMSTTLKNWKDSNLLVKHNYWHWALYHIEQLEPEAALDIFENCIYPNIRSGSMLDIVDCTSLLWRLKMEGLDVSKLVPDILEAIRPHLDDHVLLFNDVHFLMAYLVAGDMKATQYLINSLENYIESGQGTNWEVSKKFGLQLMNSLNAMTEERYSDVVSSLFPVKDVIYQMGGSHAQRDLYNIALITSAVKSQKPKDQALARSLLMARQLQKGSCTLAQRLGFQFQPFLQA